MGLEQQQKAYYNQVKLTLKQEDQFVWKKKNRAHGRKVTMAKVNVMQLEWMT